MLVVRAFVINIVLRNNYELEDCLTKVRETDFKFNPY